MAIVVEDGSVVPDANAYMSVEDVTAFAAARGVTLSEDEAVVEVMLIKATDYIAAKEAKFKGTRTSTEQELTWPRTIGGVDVGVPQKIRDAQGFLVMAAAGAVDILPVDSDPDSFPIKSEKVGPLETVFAVSDSAVAPSWPSVPGADDALAFYYGGIPGILYRYLGKT